MVIQLKEFKLYRWLFRDKLFFATVFIFSLYIYLAVYNLEMPGLSYDELNYINITLDINNNGFYQTIFDIPLYIMDYIGAFKSYVYKIIFYFFEINIYTIRLPLIIVGFFSGMIFYLILNKIFRNNKISILVLILFLLDSTFILQHRFDLGPVVFELFFKLLSFYLILEFINGIYSKRIFIILGVVLFLGLYNKLNFIWYINAVFISFMLVYSLQLRILKYYAGHNLLFINLNKFFYLLLFYLFFVFYFIFIMKYFHISTNNFDFSLRINYLLTNYYTFLNSSNFTNNWLTRLTPDYSFLFVCFILLLLLLSSFSYLLNKELKKIYFFLVSIFLIIFIQIFLTPTADKSWHLVSLYPFYHLILAFGLYILFKIFDKNENIIFVVLFTLLIAYQVNIFFSIKLQNTFKNNSSIIGFQRTIPSMAIYDLSKFIKQLDTKVPIVSCDWGIHNQLQALNNGWNLKERSYHCANNIISVIEEDVREWDHFFVIIKGNEYECLKNSGTNLLSYLESKNYKYSIKKEILEDDVLVYNIYFVQR